MGSTQRIDICQIVYKLITLLIMPTGAQCHTHTSTQRDGWEATNRATILRRGAYSKFTLWVQNVIPYKVRTSYVMWTDKTLAINQRDGAKWAWHAAHTHTRVRPHFFNRGAQLSSAQLKCQDAALIDLIHFRHTNSLP